MIDLFYLKYFYQKGAHESAFLTARKHQIPAILLKCKQPLVVSLVLGLASRLSLLQIGSK